MGQPVIAARVPAVLEMKPGKYWWCACGRSKKQPFCDGSHAGTEFTPKEFILAEAKRVALCQCKRTKTAPFCDGSHTRLPDQ